MQLIKIGVSAIHITYKRFFLLSMVDNNKSLIKTATNDPSQEAFNAVVADTFYFNLMSAEGENVDKNGYAVFSEIFTQDQKCARRQSQPPFLLQSLCRLL